MIKVGHNIFAHAATAGVSSHMATCDLVEWSELRSEISDVSYDFQS